MWTNWSKPITYGLVWGDWEGCFLSDSQSNTALYLGEGKRKNKFYLLACNTIMWYFYTQGMTL